jgi:hypothetical protein
VDGVLKQDSPVRDMIFSIPFLIGFISRFMALQPGDLIAAGAPPGVGPLEIGTTVRVEIERIGVIENTVAGEWQGSFTHRVPPPGGGWGNRPISLLVESRGRLLRTGCFGTSNRFFYEIPHIV